MVGKTSEDYAGLRPAELFRSLDVIARIEAALQRSREYLETDGGRSQLS